MSAGVGAVVDVATDIGNNLFNQRQAENARDFERDMSNSAFQRQVEDLKKAGLSPMLAYGAGAHGASTPSAAVASAAPSKSFASGLASGASAKLIQQQTLTEAQRTREATAQATIAEAKVPFSGATAEGESRGVVAQADKLGYEVNTALEEQRLKLGDLNLQSMDIEQKRAMMPLLQEYQKLVNRAEAAGIPQKEVDARFFKSLPGEIVTNWKKIIDGLTGGFSSGGVGILRGPR